MEPLVFGWWEECQPKGSDACAWGTEWADLGGFLFGKSETGRRRERTTLRGNDTTIFQGSVQQLKIRFLK